MLKPLSTQIVGSYAKPRWLARHEKIHALDGSWWRPEAEVLDEAKRDAALIALYEQERAGLDRALVDHQVAAAGSFDIVKRCFAARLRHTLPRDSNST